MCTRPPHSCTYHPCHTYSPTNQARKSVLAPDQKRKQKPEKSAPWPNQYRVRQSLKTFFSIFFLICTRKRDMRMSHCTELGYAGSECIVGSLKTGTGSRGGGTNSGSGTCTCVCVCVRVCVCVCVCVCVRVYTHIYTHKCVYIHTYICRGGIGVGCHGMCVYTHTQTHTYTRITSNGGWRSRGGIGVGCHGYGRIWGGVGALPFFFSTNSGFGWVSGGSNGGTGSILGSTNTGSYIYIYT
jgi:hypothetical protein